MTSTNDTNPRTALQAAQQLNASDPAPWEQNVPLSMIVKAMTGKANG